jgi:AcrR family transcriptional regulator
LLEFREAILTEKAGSERMRETRGLDVTVESQRRKQIVDAARACISEEGVDRLTLRKVAERARVSHATIAYYFHTRKELIDSAFLQISEEFMGTLLQRELLYGPQDLEELVTTFLDADNADARFVVQMIDAGLRDLELRGTHDEFVAYGRDRIEKSIRVGIEMGHYRDDLDPRLAAALLHTILIWWESELTNEATSRDLALDVGRLALNLLEVPDSELANARRNGKGAKLRPSENGNRTLPTAAVPAWELIEAALINDPRLSSKTASTLAETFNRLYALAADLSEAEKGHAGSAAPRL